MATQKASFLRASFSMNCHDRVTELVEHVMPNQAAENFLRYVRADRSNGEPSYASGQLTKMEPGVFLEGGKVCTSS